MRASQVDLFVLGAGTQKAVLLRLDWKAIFFRFQAQEILEKFDSETRMRKAQAEQQRAMQTVLQQSGETPQDRFPASQRNSLENGSLLRLLVSFKCLSISVRPRSPGPRSATYISHLAG